MRSPSLKSDTPSMPPAQRDTPIHVRVPIHIPLAPASSARRVERTSSRLEAANDTDNDKRAATQAPSWRSRGE